MRAGRKTNALVHQAVFKETLDLAPKYSTDFQHAALILEMLFMEENIETITIGFDFNIEKWFTEVVTSTEFDEITIKKYELTRELSICAIALAYFGPRTDNHDSRGKV